MVLVFVVAGLDAVLPFMPSESTVIAVAVVTAQTGEPNLVLLIVAAAAGAFAGDQLSYQMGRSSNRAVAARIARGRRAHAVHDWVHRLLLRRGRLLIVFARYVPGGRSATAFAAGVVRYREARFRWFTGMGVLLWAVQAALLGFLGGTLFTDRPLLGLAAGFTGGLVITGLAVAVSHVRRRPGTATRARTAEETPSGAA